MDWFKELETAVHIVTQSLGRQQLNSCTQEGAGPLSPRGPSAVLC